MTKNSEKEPETNESENKEKVKMKANPLKEENVYAFDKNDIKTLSRRVLLNDDVMYKREPPSNRHRGLTPMMISIMMIIYKAKRIAEKRGKKFFGLTLYECQTAFNVCGISNDTVRDNIRKLWKNLKFLKQVRIRKTSKSEISYYNINDDRFPCKDGTFVLGEEGSSGSKLWALSCPTYPFCSCLAKDCLMVSMLKSLRTMLTQGYLKNLEEKMTHWQQIENEIVVLSTTLMDLLISSYPEHDDYFEKLTDSELRFFAERLYEARINEEFDEEIDKIKEDVIKVIGKEERKKSKKKKAIKDDEKGAFDDIP